MKFDKAMRILVAGIIVNLCMGILYAWSVMKKALVIDYGWSNADASLPYTTAIVVFALSLLVAGVLQDRVGPRRVLQVGTVLTGLGMLLSGLSDSVMLLTITFGVVTGTGIGFGYACLSPSAMKWFHPSKKGLVNGLIAGGFGLASLYLAPITSWLIEDYSISTAFIVLGAGVLLIAVPAASTIINPPADYTPEAPKNQTAAAANKPVANATWRQMLKTPQFYMMWVMFAFSSAAGLMVIGNITSIAGIQAQIEEAAYLVGILAIFNTGGRVVMGILSDKIGGIRTLLIAFALQGLNMVLFATYDSSIMMMVGAALAGVGYGTLLAVFPSLTTDFYGLKNYGTNFGVLYTAWGISGVIGPIIAAIVVDTTGNFNMAYSISAAMMAVCVVLALVIKPVNSEELVAQTA
ncbi:L-lactate MFS transporter [Thaumasiovibrio subtropicus]|uniref:L-lactate MFS transporter n=2 Tax=Thaumasiovibrio subtropicus TaxID=1891207 RepID=UPI001FE8D9AF|nr:OFA family MFS transporter [Thaumasiovibrio subtropicus]